MRDARTTDLPATAALVADVAGGSAADWRVTFADALADPHRLFLVAEVDGEVVGLGQARHVPEGPDGAPGGWYLSGLTVAAGYRRRGLGRRLVLERLARLMARGAEAVHYAAEPDNAATIALHRALGFAPAGTVRLPGHDAPLLLESLALPPHEPEPDDEPYRG